MQILHGFVQARDQRELLRKRIKAATQIQAFVRAKKVLEIQRALQRRLFDEEMKLWPVSVTRRESMLILLRRLAFAFQPGPDDQRFVAVARVLIEDSNSPGTWTEQPKFSLFFFPSFISFLHHNTAIAP